MTLLKTTPTKRPEPIGVMHLIMLGNTLRLPIGESTSLCNDGAPRTTPV